MRDVSLKDRKHRTGLYKFLSILCVADVVRYRRLRWLGELEFKRRG